MTDGQETGQRVIYHIRTQDGTDTGQVGRWDGFATARQANGEIWMTGAVNDQAALYGVLFDVLDSGLTLLLVTQTDCPCRKRKCARRGDCVACETYHAANGKRPYCLRAKTKWSV
jgi:hypothetical protein